MSRLLLPVLLLVISCQVRAQRFELIPYIGVEAEIKYSIGRLEVEELIVTERTNAYYISTFGLAGRYNSSSNFGLELDVNYRPKYLYGYRIYDHRPFPDSDFSSEKVSLSGVDEWTISIIPSIKLADFAQWHLAGQIGLGYNITDDADKGEPVNFGEYLESTTAVWNAIHFQPTRNTFIVHTGLRLGYRRFMLQFRYVHTISRSMTDPFVYNGRSYPFINKRNGLQLVLGYSIPIGKK